MRRPAALLAWAAALSSPAAAWLKNPFLKSVAGTSWKPPAETGIAAVNQNQMALGWSPRPTEAPELYGRMALAERMEGYTLGTDTCGYMRDGNSFTCISDSATCTFSDDYIGCCDPSSTCNIVKTTCIDYDASFAGDCDLPSDFHTLCCATSAYGACFTWIISNTGSDSEPDSTYTLLDCSAASGTSTLFDYDPAWAVTHSFSSTVSSAASSATTDVSGSGSGTDISGSGSTGSLTTEPSAATSDSDSDSNGGSSTPVGAIAGGVVGGVSLIVIVGLVIFFMRRKKNKDQQTPPPPLPPNGAQNLAPPPVQQQQPMIQHPQSPQGFAPSSSSPTPTAYTSGVPLGFQGYPQQQGTPQPYDPHMSAYSGQQAYSHQPGYDAYGQQGYQQQSYQQQGQYNQHGAIAVYQPPSTASPPPNTTSSPIPKGSEAVMGGLQQQQQQQQHYQQQQQHSPQNTNELPAINPLWRAE
ncbi:hypothetical protein B0J13DRAFT_537287 [Dactylonectria estremocensis]|uniref:Uncharacterized protein n=1 Tax=Dactylonectria estremocensis TaxID=1079267 RepID=A0A9P9FHP6_9HYPO|nr:hypothetical protein B0J13DRAFT_537287 [Dactylonectria estremocensis]